jgi:hypothetical protein
MTSVERRRRAREETAERSASGFFGIAEGAFRVLGLDDAADNLSRYRRGVGGTRHYTDEEIARHRPIARAEDTNRTRFEVYTFTGRTGDKDAREALLGVRDGETLRFEDDWDRGFEYGASVLQPGRPAAAGLDLGLDTYGTFGRGEVKSQGQFTVSRRGDNLRITGEVGHGFDTEQNDNRFDFNEGQPGHRQARVLEAAGKSAPFDMQYDRRQTVAADVRRDGDGSLTVQRVRWGPLR